jgi:hypothetical protein
MKKQKFVMKACAIAACAALGPVHAQEAAPEKKDVGAGANMLVFGRFENAPALCHPTAGTA